MSLDAIRPSLDRSALSLSDEEDRASAARSSLSSQSKALKRAGADEKLAMLGGVVRAYQEEINALTRRSKGAETAFLSLYQLLIKAQDPTHALQLAMTALQQATSMEAEYTRCRQQLHELDVELSTLKNQDATLRRLEAQLREVDRRTEQRVREAIAEHDEASRQQVAQERREAAEREAALTQSLEECRQSLAQQAAAHQQQQDTHFRESEKFEKAAREAEREMDSLRADNERLQHALQTISSARDRAAEDSDRREANLSSSVSSSSASASSSAAPSSASSSVELEAEVQSLRDALSAVQLDSAESHEALRAERAEREADRQAAAESIERLTLQLAQWKHKALTSGGNSGGDNAGQQDGDAEEARDDRQSAAHSALQTELAASRALNEQLSRQVDEQQTQAASELHKLSAALQEAEATSAHHLQLIAQLEADISLLQQQQQQQQQQRSHTAKQTPSAVISKASTPFVPLSSIATSAAVGAGGHNAADSTLAPTDSLVAVTASGPTEPSADPAASLLRIVSGQRDRLRVRVEQLERELSDRQAALLEARAAKQQLQDDNVSLYEKLQYVKSFEQQLNRTSRQQQQQQQLTTAHHAFSSLDSLSSGGGSSSSSGGKDSNGSSALSERRYAKLYAESLNPFSAWKSGQLLASERSLPPSERVTLTFARLVFSRRAARSFAFFYALVLHLLVFAVLWTHTVSDHCASHAEEDT